MENYIYYIFCLIAIIVGVVIVKKVAGCLIKSVILLAIIAVMAYIYFTYFYTPA